MYSKCTRKSKYIENEYEYMTHKIYEYEYLKNILEYTSTSAPGLILYYIYIILYYIYIRPGAKVSVYIDISYFLYINW